MAYIDQYDLASNVALLKKIEQAIVRAAIDINGEAGALKYRGSSGSVTTLGAA